MTDIDDFDDLGTAPVAKYPTMAQLGSDGPKVKVVYGKGKPEEQIKETTGRLVLVRPVKLELKVPSSFEGNAPADRLSVDVVVLDGPPITNVIDKDGDDVYTFPEPLVPNQSATLDAMYTSHTVLVGQLRDLLVNGNNAPGKWQYGRLMKLNPKPGSKNKPWALGRAVDAKLAKADADLAKAWVKTHPDPDVFDN